MTTFEIELERDKADKIDEVAARGAAKAREEGYDAESVRGFLRHYFRHVDAMDVDERSVDELLGLVQSHYELARNRPSARATIAIRTPSQSEDGWTCGGATVVQIVTDDRPFLVDSVTMEVLRQGWSIREVFHPQFQVDRDLGGTLHGILHQRPGRIRGAAPGHRGPADQPGRGVLDAPGDPAAERSGPPRPAHRRPGAGASRGAEAGRGGGRGLGEDAAAGR